MTERGQRASVTLMLITCEPQNGIFGGPVASVFVAPKTNRLRHLVDARFEKDEK